MIFFESVCQWLAIITGVIAAWLWLKSAKPPATTTFNIHVVKPDMASLGQPLGGTYVGHGRSEELDQLGKDLVKQSRLSAWAARTTAVSVVMQAVALLLHMEVPK